MKTIYHRVPKPIDPASELGHMIAERGPALEQAENMQGRPGALPSFQNPNSYPPLAPMGGELPYDFTPKDAVGKAPIGPGWQFPNSKPMP